MLEKCYTIKTQHFHISLATLYCRFKDSKINMSIIEKHENSSIDVLIMKFRKNKVEDPNSKRF